MVACNSGQNLELQKILQHNLPGQQYKFLRCFAAFGKIWKFTHKSPILNQK